MGKCKNMNYHYPDRRDVMDCPDCHGTGTHEVEDMVSMMEDIQRTARAYASLYAVVTALFLAESEGYHTSAEYKVTRIKTALDECNKFIEGEK